MQAVDGVTTSSASQPSMMAIMLAQLDLRPGHRVLEIGAGTGYNAALMARLVGPQGTWSSRSTSTPTSSTVRTCHLAAAGVSDVELVCARRCTRPPARRALRPDRPHRRQRRRPPGVGRAARARRPVAAAAGVAGHPGVGRAGPRRRRRAAQRVGPPVLVRPAAGRRRRVRGGYDRGRRRVGAAGRRPCRPASVRVALAAPGPVAARAGATGRGGPVGRIRDVAGAAEPGACRLLAGPVDPDDPDPDGLPAELLPVRGQRGEHRHRRRHAPRPRPRGRGPRPGRRPRGRGGRGRSGCAPSARRATPSPIGSSRPRPPGWTPAGRRRRTCG